MPLNEKGRKIMKSMKKIEVQGQGKVMPEKRRKSKAY
jgi:hypothetical protein